MKVRIWDKELEEMHEQTFAEITEDDLWFDGETDNWSVFFDAVGEQERFILTKSTGLHDCNNELIFEKDILKPINEKYEGIFIVQREKNKDYLSICFFDFRECARCIWFINQSELEKVENDKLLNLKKIGNVFENPELLKDEVNNEV